MSITPRAETLLKTLIERYIVDGQPVGSRTLAKQAGLELSPATIRNVMADLEEMGLIRAPHTSAGRVPTPLGYRVFVDTLLKIHPLERQALEYMTAGVSDQGNAQQTLQAASALLSQITGFAGVVTVPRQEMSAFRQIEFLTVSGGRVVVVLVTEDGRVHNRVITSARRYSESELTEAANCFNATYARLPLSEVRSRILREMNEASEGMQKAMRAACEMAKQALPAADAGEASADLVVRGEANLLNVPDLGDIGRLRRLFDAFTTKRDLLHLLEQSMHGEGMQIFIGAESGYLALEECSVVTAPYQVDGNVIGMLGVVGPTRMAYDHIIPIVDVSARLLGGALSFEPK